MSQGATIINSDGSVKTTEITKVEADPIINKEAATQLPSEKTEPVKRPDKFKTDEEAFKAIAELEKKLGQQGEELGKLRGNKKAAKTEESSDTSLAIPEAKDALAAKGMDITEFETEFATNGKLADESYARLESAGFSKEQIDAHIAEKAEGNNAKAELYKIKVLQAAGIKEEALEGMKEWMSKNLSPEEITLYNETTNSGNPKLAAAMLQSVNKKYVQAVGSEGSMIHGGPTGNPVMGYASDAEMLRDMAVKDHMGKALYDTDPAYRDKIAKKIARSNYKR